RLNDDDRLAQRDFTRRGQERLRVTDRLHVNDNTRRLRVVAEVVDQVAPANVQHRADRDKRAEADVFLKAPVENGGTQRATLADEADVAGPGDRAGEGRVQAVQRSHHAQAVRADDAHAAAPGLFHDLPLKL